MSSHDQLAHLRSKVDVFHEELTNEFTAYKKWMIDIERSGSGYDSLLALTGEKNKRLVEIMAKLILAYQEYTGELEKQISR